MGESDTLKTTQVGALVRTLGYNPTTEQLVKAIQDNDTDKTGKIDFKAFLTMMETFAQGSADPAEVIKSFKKFDQDCSGTVNAKFLGMKLKSMGNKLSDDEIDYIIEQADKEGLIDRDGELDYMKFIEFMQV